MPPFIVHGRYRLGTVPSCASCRAGSQVSFNWGYAASRQAHVDLEYLSHFTRWQDLRRGRLYRCKICNQCWHLDGNNQRLTHVADERLPLVLQWGKQPIVLPARLAKVLDEISSTPPDIYGNGSNQRITPCTIETKSGECFQFAIVCIQQDAPVFDEWNIRLASEIVEISPSPFALPRDVRMASAQAEENRMGYSPSLIEMPDGRQFILNGRTNFMNEPAYKAADARIARHLRGNSTPSLVSTPDITYFIADGDPSRR